MEADIATQTVGLTSSADFSIINLFIRADIIVKLVIIMLIAASSLIICVIFLIGKYAFIEMMTDIPDIREISFAYSSWVVIITFISSFCFQFDGSFVGASQTKELRNAMIISVGIYVLSSFYLLANFGNTGLWISLCIFFIARALTLFVYLGKIIGRA